MQENGRKRYYDLVFRACEVAYLIGLAQAEDRHGITLLPYALRDFRDMLDRLAEEAERDLERCENEWYSGHYDASASTERKPHVSESGRAGQENESQDR